MIQEPVMTPEEAIVNQIWIKILLSSLLAKCLNQSTELLYNRRTDSYLDAGQTVWNIKEERKLCHQHAVQILEMYLYRFGCMVELQEVEYDRFLPKTVLQNIVDHPLSYETFNKPYNRNEI